MNLGEIALGVFVSEPAALRKALDVFVTGYGIRPPEARRLNKKGKLVGVEDIPAIRRMTDHLWLRRGLRVAQGRALEAEAIRLGYVHRKAEIYASDVTVEARRQQRKRNADTLDGTQAINLDTGETFKLAELAARSVANPRIRRGELMTRISGFEAVARGVGHLGEFWTATCPSRMHPKKSGKNGAVIDNPRYDGTLPRDAQGYLSKTWANFRAAAWRRGLRFYGFRIAEPHHDGTPHWHLLIFTPEWLRAGARAVPRLRALFRRYFLRDSGKEPGAKKNRCEFVAIDWKRGTAAGYVAKYVSKNIDGGGYQVQGDLEGEGFEEVTPSHRVEAWASRWGIRQFQQVGGPPVGVWRELRRTEEKDLSEKVQDLRNAADVGNWGRYVELMGGPTVTRDAVPVRVAYTRDGERFDYAAGETFPAPANRYGEAAKGVIYGVRDVARDRAYPSRRFRWEMRRDGNVGINGSRKAADFSTDLLRGCRGAGGNFGLDHVGVFLGTAKPGPWTRVNNCSEEVGNDGSGSGGYGAAGGRRGPGGLVSGPAPCAGNGRGLRGPDSGSPGHGSPGVGSAGEAGA